MNENQNLTSEGNTERLIKTLLDMGVPPQDIVGDITSLIDVQSKAERNKLQSQAESEQKRWHRKLKPVLLGLSCIFILLPLIPNTNPIATSSIASLGAIGFATTLFDIFGAQAFNAGRSLKTIFQIRNDDG